MAYRLTVRLTDPQKKILDKISKQTELTYTDILRRALDEYGNQYKIPNINPSESKKKRKLNLVSI